MNLCIVDKFCICINLKTGCYIIGVYYFVDSLLEIIVIALGRSQKHCYPENTYLIFCYTMVVLLFIVMVSSIYFIVGLRWDIPRTITFFTITLVIGLVAVVLMKMPCDCDYVIRSKEGLQAHYDNCSSTWSQLHPGQKCPKNPDGTLKLGNDHLMKLQMDILYHLGLDTVNYDLPAMFGDVKFVCMGGTKHRMREFAQYMAKVLNIPSQGDKLVNLTKHSQRYAMYKVGPVLSVSHGVGIPSMTTVLQEVIKLMYYAKAKDPFMFRVGTSGGLAVPAGSVVVSSFGLSGNLEKTWSVPVLGETRTLPALLDSRVCQEVYSLSSDQDGFGTYIGGTMAADDFYRGQARLDGPFCNYTEADKMEYLKTLTDLGVKNIEMEATAFSALTREAGIRAGIVCVTFLNRLDGDQVTPTKATLTDWQKRPMIVLGRYIKQYVDRQ